MYALNHLASPRFIKRFCWQWLLLTRIWNNASTLIGWAFMSKNSDLNHALKLREELQLNDAEMKRVGKIMKHLYKTVWRNKGVMFQPSFLLHGAPHLRTSFFSLVHALCESEIDSRLQEFLQGSAEFLLWCYLSIFGMLN